MPAPPPAPQVDAGSTAPAMSAPPSAPSFGGMPDVGNGMSGLGQQLADVFGSLLGTADDTLGETPDIDEPEIGEDVGDEPDDGREEDDDEPVEPTANAEEQPATEEAVDVPAADVTCESAETPSPVEPPPPDEPAPTPPELPVAAEPASEDAAEPMGAAETPCEIAADELPQVGE